MNKRVHVFIHGDVVGVGFRAWTIRNAEKLGIKGWVRNFGIKTVEAVFEGGKKELEEMIDLCRMGPEVSWVEKVDLEWEKYTGEFMNFEIRK